MIIDGKKLAEEIKSVIKMEVEKLCKPSQKLSHLGGSAFGRKLRLAVVRVGNDPVTAKFLEQKKKFGKEVGIDVKVYQLPEKISTNALRKKLAEIVHSKQNTAVIVQLPLPAHIKMQYILDGITPSKDPDMLSSKSIGLFATGRSLVMPPVVGAVKHIFEKYNVDITRKNIVVVGAGRLVGRPLALWLLQQECSLTVLNEHTLHLKPYTLPADIVVSGAGVPGLIQPDMVKDGVVVIDAGTSESVRGGQLVGDCDPAIATKAPLFTPVPGGIGPLVVAMLFYNTLTLAGKNKLA